MEHGRSLAEALIGTRHRLEKVSFRDEKDTVACEVIFATGDALAEERDIVWNSDKVKTWKENEELT